MVVDLSWYKYLHDCKPDADYGRDFSREELGAIITELESLRNTILSVETSLCDLDQELRESWETVSVAEGYVGRVG